MADEPEFKGPGHWRSQAADARHPENVFAWLAEYKRLLTDGGEDEAAELVTKAAARAKADDTEGAAELVREAAGKLHHQNAHLSGGLLSVAEKLLEAPSGEAEPDEDPGLVPHLAD